MEAKEKVNVVVLGAGFGGLTFCKHFQTVDARITLVDRTNHHLFQPLLYQVATCGLAAPDIAQPVRAILSERNDITVLLNQATGFDLAHKRVILEKNALEYDFLVLAMGSQTSYLSHPEWERFAPGLKTLNDALELRNRVLLAFENAEASSDATVRVRLMTVVIVGGGSTGVELAGAFAELLRTVFRQDFRRINPKEACIILIETSPKLLSFLPDNLSKEARTKLEQLGVQIRTSTSVKDIREGEVELDNGEIIYAANIFWTAGICAPPLTKQLGVELDKNGRVKVNSDLSLEGHSNIFAIGDMAMILGKDNKPIPGVSPAAMQAAKHVAKIIRNEIRFGPHFQRSAFKYWDKGTMATIGRSAAVAKIGKFTFTGFFAWLTWLLVHLVFLVSLRNRIAVLFNWGYSYLAYKRSSRIITGTRKK
jgi:NADH:ubiquinone reductase (H+-translocating)